MNKLKSQTFDDLSDRELMYVILCNQYVLMKAIQGTQDNPAYGQYASLFYEFPKGAKAEKVLERTRQILNQIDTYPVE